MCLGMHKQHKTTRTECWRQARALCPELFGHMNFALCRRWTGRPCPHYTAGRRKKLSVLQEQSLSARAYSLTKHHVPFTLDMFVMLARKKLKQKVSRSWCHRVFRSLNLRWKSTKQGGQARQYTATETSHYQHMLCAKMWWLLRQKGVRPERLFNMDETSLGLLPLSSKSWMEGGQKSIEMQMKQPQPHQTAKQPSHALSWLVSVWPHQSSGNFCSRARPQAVVPLSPLQRTSL